VLCDSVGRVGGGIAGRHARMPFDMPLGRGDCNKV
jgi:hypothetical protein